MTKINPYYRQLQAGYLFPEIARRTQQFQQSNPNVKLIRLGIGDTTLPLTPSIIKGLHQYVDELAKQESYSGYGAERGNQELREDLANLYAEYRAGIEADEIFVSDGAKTDSANIQSIFKNNSKIAVQDPVYPVYVDSAVIGGMAGVFKKNRYSQLVYMPCTEANAFFPELPKQKVDLIYLCSPNNPTGAVATKAQLKKFVDYARKHKIVIIFDAAYAQYIKTPTLPRSIYEIPGAKECAIEINSFSKWAGFTGVRLGWTIVPKKLRIEDSQPGELNSIWNRRQSTMFNGASNIAQAGGRAVLSRAGRRECQRLVDYYMKNAKHIRAGLEQAGYTVFGGVDAPYVWLKTPTSISSWEFFDKLMQTAHIIGTPGAGFGAGGEGYFRLSAFGDKAQVAEAVKRIKEKLPNAK